MENGAVTPATDHRRVGSEPRRVPAALRPMDPSSWAMASKALNEASMKAPESMSMCTLAIRISSVIAGSGVAESDITGSEGPDCVSPNREFRIATRFCNPSGVVLSEKPSIRMPRGLKLPCSKADTSYRQL